jgi:hypothetical protein
MVVTDKDRPYTEENHGTLVIFQSNWTETKRTKFLTQQPNVENHLIRFIRLRHFHLQPTFQLFPGSAQFGIDYYLLIELPLAPEPRLGPIDLAASASVPSFSIFSLLKLLFLVHFEDRWLRRSRECW